MQPLKKGMVAAIKRAKAVHVQRVILPPMTLDACGKVERPSTVRKGRT